MSDAERAAAADRLLSIGTFGRRARLSVKALRLYDRTGLLAPAAVDPRTGYRRYRESQLLRARLIVMMRRVGIPLAQVAEIVAAPGPEGADLLAAYWAEAERRFGVQRELVSRLRTSLLSATSPVPAGAFGIRERDVAAQLVLTEKRSLRITELKGWLPEALHRLAATAASHGGLDGDVFAVYHGEVNEDSDGPVEVCAPIARGQTPGPASAGHRRPARGRAPRGVRDDLPGAAGVPADPVCVRRCGAVDSRVRAMPGGAAAGGVPERRRHRGGGAW